jgi:hypothetical protein
MLLPTSEAGYQLRRTTCRQRLRGERTAETSQEYAEQSAPTAILGHHNCDVDINGGL